MKKAKYYVIFSIIVFCFLLSCGTDNFEYIYFSETVEGIYNYSPINNFGYDFWFIDSKTRIALGKDSISLVTPAIYLYRYSLAGSNGLPPINGWEGEFFCSPDSIVYVWNSNFSKSAYLMHLFWLQDKYISYDRKKAGIAFYYSNFEVYSKEIKDIGILTPDSEPLNLEIKEFNYLISGFYVSPVFVSIKNLYSEPVNIIYLYQDAAYMWFPRGTQKDVQLIFFPVDNSTDFTNVTFFSSNCSERYFFAGTFDPEHNIIAGLYSDFSYSYSAVLTTYIGNNISNFEDLTNFLYEKSGLNVVEENLKNRAIIFYISSLPPGEKREFWFYRVMMGFPEEDGSITPVEWKRLIVSAINEFNRIPKSVKNTFFQFSSNDIIKKY